MAKRKYGVFGPFKIPRHDDKGIIVSKSVQDFWEEVRKNDQGLPDAKGCYIFGIRAGRGITPWYIGQTKKTFRQECFAPHKIRHYNDLLADRKKGTPILFFLARQKSNGKFQDTLGETEADILENLLIYVGLQANQKLLNVKGTSFFKEAEIPGLLNSPPGAPSESAELLKRLLNLG